VVDASADARYRAIGRFIYEFSQLEYVIRYYLVEEAGVMPEPCGLSAGGERETSVSISAREAVVSHV
jgi:hypothetical protein